MGLISSPPPHHTYKESSWINLKIQIPEPFFYRSYVLRIPEFERDPGNSGLPW